MAEKHVKLPEPAKPNPIRLSVGAQDSILWTCDEPFTILRVRRHGAAAGRNPKRTKGVPKNPFFRGFPADCTADCCLNSGPPKKSSQDYEYKFSYKIGKKRYDPNIIIDP